MEETLMNRLQQMINNIQTLSNTAGKLNSVSVLNSDDQRDAEVVCKKLEMFISRFNAELNNYFRLSNEPAADDISRFTSIQLQAEEIQIELSMKLKVKNPVSSNTNTISSKLPKLNLPVFDGNILKWQEFWDQYQSNIHDRNLPDVDKLLYLKSSLQGLAKKAIEGLESTNKNYQIAITTLRDRYGKESQVIDAHYSALSKIQPAENSNQDCRRVLNEVERHLRVLSSLGEDMCHNHLRYLILEKFPEELVYEIKTKMKTDSIQDIRTELENTISAREEASRLVQDRKTIPTNSNNYTIETLHITNENNRSRPNLQPAHSMHRTGYKQSFPTQRDGYEPSFRPASGSGNFNKTVGRFNNRASQQSRASDQTRTFNTGKRNFENKTEEREPVKKKDRLSCIFCEEAHYNDECIKYKDIKQRKKKLINRCYKCLRKGHQFQNCISNKSCIHCGASHNRALCPKKFPFPENASQQ